MSTVVLASGNYATVYRMIRNNFAENSLFFDLYDGTNNNILALSNRVGGDVSTAGTFL